MRRVKFTIAVCALLVLALGASQAYAQVGGYDVLKSHRNGGSTRKEPDGGSNPVGLRCGRR